MSATDWTEAMEDLLDRDDLDGAIALVESVVSRLQTPDPSSPPSDPHIADLRLAAALSDLADLHSTRGCSLKADDLRARSILARERAARGQPEPSRHSKPELDNESAKDGIKALTINEDAEDDWEAIVDRVPSDIGVKKSLARESEEIPLETKSEAPKRRGRGSFMYKKGGLYSDEQNVRQDTRDSGVEENSDQEHAGEIGLKPKNTGKFGTRHVLVLYDFSPSTLTTDLEKCFEKFGNSEVAIRWVNDTCALAVFQTPASAYEAQSSISFPFKVRLMDESDTLLNQISIKDLEPPLPRPKTSARTAHRIITQVMGLKPSPDFGFNELKKQEQARKDRIRARQISRDDAWGPDDP